MKFANSRDFKSTNFLKLSNSQCDNREILYDFALDFILLLCGIFIDIFLMLDFKY